MTDILIAPFSNSSIRDWPVEHYTALIGLLLDDGRLRGRLRVIGTAGQRLRACDIARPYPSDRVINECGRMPWPGVLAAIRGAMCVIGNNSGIAHVSGSFGTPTVCVFGGSHQRTEWRPRGARVMLLSRVIGCSPCQLDHGNLSPFGKACLREIAPASVRDAVFEIIGRAQSTSAAHAEGR
jgi:ADP-heptose:LPS heptosyltransferase